MSKSRPKLGYSNIHWNKIDRKSRRKVSIQNLEEEVLEDATPILTIEDDLIDRIQLKALSDTFCPPHLTSNDKSVILLTSPKNNGEKNE